LNNEKACRIVIDAILTEVLLNESNEQLLGEKKAKIDCLTEVQLNESNEQLLGEKKKQKLIPSFYEVVFSTTKKNDLCFTATRK
jgi:hypothetical protein